MKIGITLTSSMDIDKGYIELTRSVAQVLAKRGDSVVYGGTDYGMMATLAESYKESGGQELIGVMAKDLMKVTKGYIAYEGLDSSFLENTMEDRKRKIIDLSDAFLILPGGYGTFEEIGTILGGKVNKLFDKPIAIYDHNGFYGTLLRFFEEMQSKNFSKIPLSDFVFVSDNLEEIMNHFENYRPKNLADKFV